MTAINAPIESAEVPTDTPCRRCQYNLRGLRTDAVCPECATPVALSVRDDRLQNADPAWLRTLRRGMLIFVWSLALFVPYLIVSLWLRQLFHSAVAGPLSRLADIPWLIGAWLITTPDPGGLGEELYGTVRRIVRVTLAISLANRLLQVPWLMTTIPRVLSTSLTIVLYLVSAIGVVGQVALLTYLGKLASRIPDDAIARRSRFLTVALGVCSSFGFLNGIFFTIYVHHAKGAIAMTSTYVRFQVIPVAFFGLASFVFGIMEFFLFWNFSKRLREAAAYAERSWQPSGGRTTLT